MIQTSMNSSALYNIAPFCWIFNGDVGDDYFQGCVEDD